MGLSIQSNPSWWTLPWLPIDHVTVSMDAEHHGLNLWRSALRWSRFFIFLFFPPLSSRVTLSSPQAMQEDCSARGKWLANPEQSGSQTGWTLLTAIVTQIFGDIAEERTRALAPVISFYTCGNLDWGVIKSTYRRQLYPLFNLALNPKV